MSRGTAMSMSTSGRPLARAHDLGRARRRSTIGCGEEVEATTMSASCELRGQRVERADARRRSARPASARGRRGGWRRRPSRTPWSASAWAVSSRGLAGADDRRRGARARSPTTSRGEVDGDGRDARRGSRAIAGLRAHALAGLQRGAEQAVGQRPGRAGLEREPRRRGGPGPGPRPRRRSSTPGRAVDAVELARGVAVARRVDDVGELGRADAGAAWRAGRAARPRRAPGRRRRGRARCGCRSRSRRPRRPRRARRARAGSARPRARSAPGARAARPARSCARCRGRAARSCVLTGSRSRSSAALVGQLVELGQLALEARQLGRP